MIDFVELKKQITMRDVLSLLTWRPQYTIADEHRGYCPICEAEKSGRRQKQKFGFGANVAKQVFNCNRCGSHGNALDLYLRVQGQPIYQAAKELCERLRVPVPVLERHAQLPGGRVINVKRGALVCLGGSVAQDMLRTGEFRGWVKVSESGRDPCN